MLGAQLLDDGGTGAWRSPRMPGRRARAHRSATISAGSRGRYRGNSPSRTGRGRRRSPSARTACPCPSRSRRRSRIAPAAGPSRKAPPAPVRWRCGRLRQDRARRGLAAARGPRVGRSGRRARSSTPRRCARRYRHPRRRSAPRRGAADADGIEDEDEGSRHGTPESGLDADERTSRRLVCTRPTRPHRPEARAGKVRPSQWAKSPVAQRTSGRPADAA